MCYDRFMLNACESFMKSIPSEHYWMVLDGVDHARAFNVYPTDIWKLAKWRHLSFVVEIEWLHGNGLKKPIIR